MISATRMSMKLALVILFSCALAETHALGDSRQEAEKQECTNKDCATNTDPTSLLMTKQSVSELSRHLAKKDMELDQKMSSKASAEAVADDVAGRRAAREAIGLRFLRFTVTKVMGENEGHCCTVQISKISFKYHDSEISMDDAVATNPGGDSPSHQGPHAAIDGSTNTKWFDRNVAPLTIDFQSPVLVDSFTFTTGDDARWRDPIRWILEGSNDGSAWVELHRQVEDFPTTVGRGAQQQWFDFTDWSELPFSPSAVLVAPYMLLTSGMDCHRVTSISECETAAAFLGKTDTTASSDGQSNVGYDPPYCYYEGGRLKYNSDGTNTGSCGTDECLCKDCMFFNFKWDDPLDMPGQSRSVEITSEACRQRCATVNGCAHFSWWADGGCHLTPSSSMLYADNGVTSGPPICPRAIPFRFFRFTVTKVMGEDARMVQISEISFKYAGSEISMDGAVATNPGGSPFNPSEGPHSAIDGSTNTKWLDRNILPLMIDFQSSVAVDSFTFTTGDDRRERDPIRWTLQGRNEGTSWVDLHRQVQDFITTVSRRTQQQWFELTGVTEVTPDCSCNTEGAFTDEYGHWCYLAEERALTQCRLLDGRTPTWSWAYCSGIVCEGVYILVTSGTDCNRVTSLSECSTAAARLGKTDTTASSDGQSNVGYDPPYCYYEGGRLKYNSDGTNTGSCGYDECLCKVPNCSCKEVLTDWHGDYCYLAEDRTTTLCRLPTGATVNWQWADCSIIDCEVSN